MSIFELFHLIVSMNSSKFSATLFPRVATNRRTRWKGQRERQTARASWSNNGKDVCLMVGEVRKQRRAATSSPRIFTLQIHRRRRPPWSFKPSAVPTGVHQPRIQSKTKCTLTKWNRVFLTCLFNWCRLVSLFVSLLKDYPLMWE